jgi:hypothetical protein
VRLRLGCAANVTGVDAGLSGDMSHNVLERLRRPPVEPPAVEMEDCLTRSSSSGTAPPSMNSAYWIFVGVIYLGFLGLSAELLLEKRAIAIHL